MSTAAILPKPGGGGAWQKIDGKWQSAVGEKNANIKPKLGDIKTERNLDIQEMLKKYSSRIENQKKKKKKKKKSSQNNVVEWVDNSFIKKYTDHDAMKELLESLETKHFNILECYKLGHSTEGRELLCVRITQDSRHQRPLLRPMVKLVANIHGDEAVGREMLIGLIRYLTDSYESDERIRRIIDTTDLHILPSANPDGDAADTRHNINDEDLNRGFPGWRDMGRPRAELVRDREKEVKCLMNWILDNPFVLSVSFHDGRVMINYPWDDSPDAEEGEECVCPDDDVFKHLASLYAENHPFMWTGKCLCHSDQFSAGISNGAEWYLVDDGMQDFNYLFSNCLELTAELSCWKRPPAHHLQVEWENNLDSMLAIIESVHTGVRGLVTCGDTGASLERAEVRLEGREKNIVTTLRGEYWRILVPGTYQLQASHSNKFGSLESELVTVTVSPGAREAVTMDLVCRVRLEDSFLVTGVRQGFCRFLDNTGLKREVAALFEDARVTKLELCEDECRKVPDDPVNFQVGFRVDIAMAYSPMAAFFNERWGEAEVRRPTSEFDMKKLSRRAAMYSEERWGGRRGAGDWVIRRRQRPESL